MYLAPISETLTQCSTGFMVSIVCRQVFMNKATMNLPTLDTQPGPEHGSNVSATNGSHVECVLTGLCAYSTGYEHFLRCRACPH